MVVKKSWCGKTQARGLRGFWGARGAERTCVAAYSEPAAVMMPKTWSGMREIALIFPKLLVREQRLFNLPVGKAS